MEHLWTPWRNNYVTQNKPGQNKGLFSSIAQSTEDEKNFVLARSKLCFAVLNVYPYNAGHLMIIPYRETAVLEELDPAEWADMFEMLKKMKTALTAALKPHGFNVGLNLGVAAGAGVADHLHLHVVPRWENDSSFMTTTGDTRVHPNDLPGVYQQIKAQLS